MNNDVISNNNASYTQNRTPLLSVIMAVYNERSALIKAAVESILLQTFRDFEYIIVLDDPSNTEAKTLLREYAKRDARIRVLINDKNEGLTYSLNRAVKEANGTYVSRMDADDISFLNRFEVQIAFLKEHNLDFVGSFVQTIDDSGETITPCIKVPTTNGAIQKTLRVNNCLFHPTWFLKKSVFDAVGEYKGRYIEDYDFILRAKNHGFTFGNVPEVLLKYRMSTKSISRSNAFTQYLHMRYVQRVYFGRGFFGFCSHEKPHISISAEDFVKKHYSDKKAQNYEKASTALTNALYFVHNKQFLRASVLLVKAGFSSRAFFAKLVRYAVQSLR